MLFGVIMTTAFVGLVTLRSISWRRLGTTTISLDEHELVVASDDGITTRLARTDILHVRMDGAFFPRLGVINPISYGAMPELVARLRDGQVYVSPPLFLWGVKAFGELDNELGRQFHAARPRPATTDEMRPTEPYAHAGRRRRTPWSERHLRR